MPISNTYSVADSFYRPTPTASAGAQPAAAAARAPLAPTMTGDALQLSALQKREVGALAKDPYLQTFLSHDGNLDGLLSGNEVEEASRAFDQDGDGELNAHEYLAGQNQAKFADADANRDGKLTGNETNRILKPWRAAADANKDGGVDATEYRATRHGLREVGYNNDKNDDGFLTGAEIKPAAQKYAQTDGQGRSLLTRESYMQQKVAELNAQRPAGNRVFGTR